MSQNLKQLATLVRHHILTATTAAGSGHPTTSLSATDLMTVLFFKHLRFDSQNPKHPNNDRVVFSKGHAAPLLYALHTVAGTISCDQLKQLRKLGCALQGHPTPALDFVDAATGSLGQGLSVGVGLALNAKYLDQVPYRSFVLLGDGEMAEGSCWEAIQLATHYKLDNLIGFIDVNRLGQSQETMYGHDAEAYAKRVSAFGWHTEVIDGHDIEAIDQVLEKVLAVKARPKMIIAKTEKGKGISFLSNKDGWHGKALPQDKLEEALKELGEVDVTMTAPIKKPDDVQTKTPAATQDVPPPSYQRGEKVATRKAFGLGLAKLIDKYPSVISLDGDCKNSTFAEDVAKAHPDHFFEMFIAEQNMVGVAIGLSKCGKVPFVSSFAAFLTRTFDQLRMGVVSEANIKCVGSHVGVSIGEDGPSQMGLEDLAMFRSLHGSTIFYPSDAVSAERLVEAAINQDGLVYIRTNRPATEVIYEPSESFPIGGSKTLRSSDSDDVTLVAAGVTLHEALQAQKILLENSINARVIDLYSVKPIDQATLQKASHETKALFVIEDHWAEGGLGDAVLSALAERPQAPVIKMAVTALAGSGTPKELLAQAGLDAASIVKRVKGFLHP